ncbi:MAG: cytochrome C oxidase subunit IV family protein [Flavobacteriaceae bacterium]
MENITHKLEIFRGLWKFKSNQQKIWGVLFFLSVVTIIEVALGIIKPEILIINAFLGTKLINWIFIILTIIKAYYIAWDFMHLRDEKSGLQASIVITLIFLIAYLVFILIVEGNYIYDVMYEGFVSWNF